MVNFLASCANEARGAFARAATVAVNAGPVFRAGLAGTIGVFAVNAYVTSITITCVARGVSWFEMATGKSHSRTKLFGCGFMYILVVARAVRRTTLFVAMVDIVTVSPHPCCVAALAGSVSSNTRASIAVLARDWLAAV